MKRLKAFLCLVIVSTALVTNTLASGSVVGPVPDLIVDTLDYIASLFGSGACPLRQCTACKPVNEGENGGGGGSCRPKD